MSFRLVICGCTVKVAGCGSSNGVSDSVSQYDCTREDPWRILGRPTPSRIVRLGMFAYYAPWVLTSSLEGVVRYGVMRSCTGSLGVCAFV